MTEKQSHPNPADAGKASAGNGLESLPAGWRLMPVELTHEMIDAANSARGWVETDSLQRGCYRAMLAAAPQPPQAEAVAPDLRDTVLIECAELLEGYARHHTLRGPEHAHKVTRNAQQAARCRLAASEQAKAAQHPEVQAGMCSSRDCQVLGECAHKARCVSPAAPAQAAKPLGWAIVDKNGEVACWVDAIHGPPPYNAELARCDRDWPGMAPHRAVQLVELTPQLAAAGEVLEALKLAKAMFIANDMSLPHTMAIIDAAIAKAEGQKGGAL